MLFVLLLFRFDSATPSPGVGGSGGGTAFTVSDVHFPNADKEGPATCCFRTSLLLCVSKKHSNGTLKMNFIVYCRLWLYQILKKHIPSKSMQ